LAGVYGIALDVVWVAELDSEAEGKVVMGFVDDGDGVEDVVEVVDDVVGLASTTSVTVVVFPM
jgi:hypothetical protein